MTEGILGLVPAVFITAVRCIRTGKVLYPRPMPAREAEELQNVQKWSTGESLEEAAEKMAPSADHRASAGDLRSSAGADNQESASSAAVVVGDTKAAASSTSPEEKEDVREMDVSSPARDPVVEDRTAEEQEEKNVDFGGDVEELVTLDVEKTAEDSVKTVLAQVAQIESARKTLVD